MPAMPIGMVLCTCSRLLTVCHAVLPGSLLCHFACPCAGEKKHWEPHMENWQSLYSPGATLSNSLINAIILKLGYYSASYSSYHFILCINIHKYADVAFKNMFIYFRIFLGWDVCIPLNHWQISHWGCSLGPFRKLDRTVLGRAPGA